MPKRLATLLAVLASSFFAQAQIMDTTYLDEVQVESQRTVKKVPTSPVKTSSLPPAPKVVWRASSKPSPE
jgi:hypothetical protein